MRALASRTGSALLALLLLAGVAAAGLPKAPKLPKAPALPAAPAAPGAMDPKAWLDQADAFLADVEGARSCLDASRGALFGLAATAEEKKLLEETRAVAAEKGEDLVLATRKVEDEVLAKAREEKRLESRKLAGAQRDNMARLGGNLLLAIQTERRALETGKTLLGKADDAVKAARDPGTALRLGKDAGRVLALPDKLGSTLQEIPAQLSSLQALLQAVEQSRKANDFPLAAPAGGGYGVVEEF